MLVSERCELEDAFGNWLVEREVTDSGEVCVDCGELGDAADAVDTIVIYVVNDTNGRVREI